MSFFSISDFRLKSVFASLKILLPLAAVVFSTNYLVDRQSSANGERQSRSSSSAMNCGDGWDNRFADGANGDVLAIAVDANGILYAGGEFTQIGGVAANHIARWDGLNWSPLGGGTDDYVSVIRIGAGNEVYAGGEFVNAGGASAKHIARWNGLSWSPLGDGTDAHVSAMAISGSDVYAGGFFTNAGGVPANFVAKWNGANWSPLGDGTGDVVTSLAATAGGAVYVGGFFETAGGAAANRVAKWDGVSWSPLGDGADGDVYALAASGNDLYVGGAFYAAGGVGNTTRIARWDGTNWSPLGTGANDTVYAIAASGGDIYAGGFFTKTNQVSTNRVARWNGANWSPLGDGTNNAATALAASSGYIYAGGTFSSAGCRASGKIARYFAQSFSGNTNNDWHNQANWTNGAVPGINSDVNIGAADTVISTSDAAIRDLRVDEGRTLTIAADRTLIVSGRLNLLGNVNGAGTIFIADCSPSAILRGMNSGYVRSSLVRCVNNSGAFDFPVGTANGYSPVQLSNIAGAGNFTVKAVQGAYPSEVSGLSNNRLQRFWNLTNGGIGSADVQFNYLSGDVFGTEADYKIFRISGTTAENISGTVNATNHTATVTNVSSFSPWTLGEELVPTAAMVSVGGRVLTSTGRGISGAQVVLIRANGEIRYARTNPFGFYNFKDVAAGETYTVNVVHKSYAFAPRVVTVTEDLNGLNFTAAQ